MKVIYPNSQRFVKHLFEQTWIMECVYGILGLSQDFPEINRVDCHRFVRPCPTKYNLFELGAVLLKFWALGKHQWAKQSEIYQ